MKRTVNEWQKRIDALRISGQLLVLELRVAELRKRYAVFGEGHRIVGNVSDGSGGKGGGGVDKSGKSGIIESGKIKETGSDSMGGRKISNIYTGIRSEEPLTPEEKNDIKAYFQKLGVDTDNVMFSDVQRTVYNEKHDYFIIGTDVKPKENPSKGTAYANQRVSIKGTIAHEVIGHREAHLKGWTQKNDIYEEVQASIRAARFAPDLSNMERIALLRDARARLSKGVRLKDVKDFLYIKEE